MMDKSIERVSLIGLGALGILYAEHIQQAIGKENLRIIADRNRISRYKSDGIFYNGNICDFNYVLPDDPVEPADLILFAVKFNGLDDAIRKAQRHVGPDTIILSVLNGVVSERIIAEAFGKDHLLYTVAQGMTAVKEKNYMTCHQKGILCFGELDAKKNSEKVERVKRFFDRIKLPYEINNQMKTKLWSKLMINVGVNQTVGYFNATNQIVQKQGEARDMVVAAMEEVLTIAKKEGVGLTRNDIDYWLKIIDNLEPEGSPSMAQDVKAGRNTEVDLFAGTIVSLARKHGVSVPVNEMFLKHFI